MNTHTSLGRRIVAALGAAAVGLAGAVALASPASAAIPANIDNSRNGNSTITVHKHAQPSPVGEAGDGTELDTAPANPLSGVEFSLYKLSNIDLTTVEGWTTATAVSTAINGGAVPVPDADPATSVTIGGTNYPVTPVETQETGTDGAATFGNASGAAGTDDLGFGIYLIVEGADKGDNNITDKAAPFIVSLPFATGDNTWNYDVHAYPKNSVTAITKTVKEPAAGSAEDLNRDLVRWEIALDVPNLTTGDTLTKFEIVDTIVAAELSFVATLPTGVDGNSFTVTDAAGTVLTVPAGTFEWDPTTPAGITLTLKATTVGLEWLQNNAQGGTVTASILTKLVAVGDGEVTNSVVGNVNDGTVTTDTPTDVGELEIFKWADTSSTETPTITGLGGAKFALYLDTAKTQRVVVNGVNEWGPTTDTGYLKISNLKPGSYYLVETVAPTGYQLDTAPREVTIVAGQTVRPTGAANEIGTNNYKPVENQQVSEWKLPLTGANGQLLALLGGGALVLLAGGTALVARKRSHQNQG
ncbi:SpaH/EbpB family LPXTG-anchored major pilin [Actinomyces provencensis]|uniref:SpaH/EbpB family LPXTG-anchored major pilin n=1 Tax=Actinomyces provencensis TaxID=1720198 RepID=UPI00096A352F|nr:SpaH/EbpB family LPXTG-anchored major pilin [Actinomyces provencensis]